MEVESSVITFVTSNQNKIDEANFILKDYDITLIAQKIDLPELQGDLDFICISKCKAAAAIINGPVIVEDTSLSFNALNSLPGPYIKWFQKIGSDGLVKLLAAYKDKSASAKCTLGFTKGPGKEIFLCQGETTGTIVAPRGKNGFAWDNCFLPDGSMKTYAEMSFEEKNIISHRKKAFDSLKTQFNLRQVK